VKRRAQTRTASSSASNCARTLSTGWSDIRPPMEGRHFPEAARQARRPTPAQLLDRAQRQPASTHRPPPATVIFGSRAHAPAIAPCLSPSPWTKPSPTFPVLWCRSTVASFSRSRPTSQPPHPPRWSPP
jgi:hypothetical protein